MALSGGCLCGAVRYRLKSAPFDCGWCHCRTCQLYGGAPAMPFATVLRADFAWTAGESAVRWVESSSFGKRAFCGECGSPLQVRVDHQPETVDFPIITLDEPEAIAPAFHIFWGSRVAWFEPGDCLPRHDKFRPDTRGLDSAEPPDESSLTGGRG
ncbi:MAG TPA: GFA family protein [Sphingomicrobium sp.]